MNTLMRIRTLHQNSSSKVDLLMSGNRLDLVPNSKLFAGKKYLKRGFDAEYEIEVMKELQQLECVPKVFGKSHPEYDIITEFIKFPELTKFASSRQKEDTSKLIINKLARSVLGIHSLGYAHCDLKLENVMMDDMFNIRIIDFGSSRRIEFDENNIEEFCTGPCGTIWYLPPEVAKKEMYHVSKVDVWQIGIILYILIFNVYPFDGNDELVIKTLKLYKHTNLNLTGTSPELKEFLRNCLHHNPDQRWSMSDMLEHVWLK